MYIYSQYKFYAINIHRLHEQQTISTTTNATKKKCSNCGGIHTANYRGCPVCKDLKTNISQGIQAKRN